MTSRFKQIRINFARGLLSGLALAALVSGMTFISHAETDSGGIPWKVIYTDKDTHSKHLCETETGVCAAGDTIYIGVPQTIIDENGTIWETDEESGEREIPGPGTEIIYIEYIRAGEVPGEIDPYEEAEEELAEWIEVARKAESELTGKSESQIMTSGIICNTEGKARLRLLSAAAAVSDTSRHEVYVIAVNLIPTGTVLKEYFGTGIVYSNDLKASVEIGDDIYRVHRFVITKIHSEDTCHHTYEIYSERAATCIDRGVTKYRCIRCKDEYTVYHAASGHTDDDDDGICDVCHKSTETSKPASWSIGDVVTERVGDEEYTFRCIDEDYSDYKGNKTGSALFLCDTVIPAGLGGEYREETDRTGHLVQVWHPGPIAYFGDTNNYKYSKIKAFLDETSVHTAAQTLVGLNSSYTGSTEQGKFSQLTDAGLKSYSIGYQQMTSQLFILSVDEALRYRKYLWKFGETSVDNPEEASDTTAHGYWLRSPAGTAADYSASGLLYIVDLDGGNIHAQAVKPSGGTGDPYIDTQTSVGIRPALTLKNNK